MNILTPHSEQVILIVTIMNLSKDIWSMSGDNSISLDEVMTADKYNMAKMYKNQHTEDDNDDLD